MRGPDLYAAILTADGGFTIDQSGALVTEGYAVSAHPEASFLLSAQGLTRDQFSDYVASYRAANHSLLSVPGACVGAWNDPETGLIWLDVSRVASTPAEASRIGTEANQLAYFDLGLGVSVALSGTGLAQSA